MWKFNGPDVILGGCVVLGRGRCYSNKFTSPLTNGNTFIDIMVNNTCSVLSPILIPVLITVSMNCNFDLSLLQWAP